MPSRETSVAADLGAAETALPKGHRKALGGGLGMDQGTVGWVIFPRWLFSHGLFGDEPYNKRLALLWLIASARFAPGVLKTKRGTVRLGRGQLAAANTYLAEAWGWERGKVRRFLRTLTKATIICSDRAQGLQVITICNYEQFQRLNAATVQGPTTTRSQDARNQNGRDSKTPRSTRSLRLLAAPRAFDRVIGGET